MASTLELWGIEDVAEYLGIEKNTAYMQKHRGKIPEPEWVVSGRPIWRANVIRKWFEKGAKGATRTVATATVASS